MNCSPTRTLTWAAGGLFCLSLAILPSEAQEAPPAARGADSAPAGTDGNADFDALARGPIHEAAAQPFDTDPEPAPVVPSQPPEPINEVPPELAPDGENVVWIPGYWGWDDAENRFLWISGFWRDAPPGQQWVPGSWIKAEEGGYRWIAGFWTESNRGNAEYLPYPPKTQEIGPTYDAPAEDHFWVPGCWVHKSNDYAWRPGYWAPGNANWVWVPSQYVWTPDGAIFVSGYWDYPLSDRGLLFAPVHFHRPVWQDPGYRYTPSAVLNWSALLVHLFVRPRYHHYYVGDYYGNRYADFGFQPWYGYGGRRGGYDPLLTYYSWASRRRGINFVSRMRGWHNYYRRHEDLRPPHRHRDLADRIARGRSRRVESSVLNNLALVKSLDAAARDDKRRRLRRIDEKRHEVIVRGSKDFRNFQQRRRQRADRGDGEKRDGEKREEIGRNDRRGGLNLSGRRPEMRLYGDRKPRRENAREDPRVDQRPRPRPDAPRARQSDNNDRRRGKARPERFNNDRKRRGKRPDGDSPRRALPQLLKGERPRFEDRRGPSRDRTREGNRNRSGKRGADAARERGKRETNRYETRRPQTPPSAKRRSSGGREDGRGRDFRRGDSRRNEARREDSRRRKARPDVKRRETRRDDSKRQKIRRPKSQRSKARRPQSRRQETRSRSSSSNRKSSSKRSNRGGGGKNNRRKKK